MKEAKMTNEQREKLIEQMKKNAEDLEKEKKDFRKGLEEKDKDKNNPAFLQYFSSFEKLFIFLLEK